MITVKEYSDYFEELCENHPLLLHAKESGAQVFLPISIDQAIGSFRSGIKAKNYFFRVILYTGFMEEVASDPRKNLQCGFIIGKYHRQDYDSYLTALSDSEKVLGDFVARMVKDSNDGHPLFSYSINTVADIQFLPTEYTGDQNYSGYICTFVIRPRFDQCVEGNLGPGWLDLIVEEQ